MSSKSRLLKNSGLYSVIQILQKCIGFFLLPVYTLFMPTEEKGLSDVVLTTVAFFSIFYTFAITSSVLRFYSDYKEDEKKLKDFWGTCTVFVLINGIIMTVLLIIARNFTLMPMTDWKVEFYPYLIVGLISITLNPVYSIFQSTLQAKEESKKYALNNLFYFLCNFLLNILFVVGFKLGGLGILLALAITDLFAFIYTVIVFFPNITLRINIKYLKEALKYSLPLLPHTLSGSIIAAVDKLFLNKFIGLGVTGIYSIASQFGNIISVVTTAVNQAYVPWFFNKMRDKKKNEKEIVNIAESLTMAYGFLAMVMSFFVPEIFKIFLDHKYLEGWKIIPTLVFAYVFNGIYYFFVNPLFYSKKGVKYIAIGTFTAAILNSVFNIVFIPIWGSIGAALASLMANIIACLLIYFISKKLEPLKFNVIKMFSIVAVFYGLALCTFVFERFSMPIAFLIKLTITIGIIVIYALNNLKETKKIFNYVKNVIIKKRG